MERNPDMVENEIYTTINGEFEARNEAQIFRAFEYVNRFGRMQYGIKPSTKTAFNISNLPVNNFGCIMDLNIDTIPTGVMLKGTEIMEINQEGKECMGKSLINRRFLSLILLEWSYIYGTKYYPWKGKAKRGDSGMEIWCKRFKIKSTHKYTKDMISGIEGEQLLLQIIEQTRDKNPRTMYEYRERVNRFEKANEIAVLQITYRMEGKNQVKESESIINEMYFAWDFPRYSVEYLYGLINELNSGHYFKECYVPIIYNLWDYPIKNTDVHIKPMSEEEFEQARNEYEQAVVENLQYGD